MAEVIDMYVRIKILVATFDTDNTQSIAASIQELADYIVK